MSTEIPQSRKINIEPASTEELRAAFLVDGEADIHKTSDNTAANEAYNKALQEELERQKKLDGKNRTKNMTKFVLIGAGVATVGVGGAVVASEIGANANHTATPQEQAAQPTHSAGDILPTAQSTSSTLDLPSSSPSPSSIDTAVKPGNYELKVGLEPAAVGYNVTGLVDSWGMKGTAPGLGGTDEVLRTPLKTYAQKKAAQNTQEMAPKILGPNYLQKMASNPNIASFVSKQEAADATDIEAFVHTDNTGLSERDANPNNEEAWKRTTTFESVKSSTHNPDGSTTDIYAIQETNNAYMNIYKSVVTDTKIDELLTVTYKPLGDTLDITDITITKAP